MQQLEHHIARSLRNGARIDKAKDAGTLLGMLAASLLVGIGAVLAAPGAAIAWLGLQLGERFWD